jgi:hypothetical protein
MKDPVGWFVFIAVAFFLLRPAFRAFRAGMRGEGENRANGYTLEVVGEASYQKNLIAAAGTKGEESTQVFVDASVVCEEGNPHDPHAVRVDIKGRTVGYLSRPTARIWRETASQKQVVCPAVIRGGWDRGRGDSGNYGVWLAPPREFG